MEFNSGKPIYRQIAHWMCDKILRREWGSGERIPSVRDTAMILQVNPNTAMRAYDALQSEDVIYNKRGIGYFVSEDAFSKIKVRERAEFITEVLPAIFERMKLLEVTSEELQKEFDNFKTSEK